MKRSYEENAIDKNNLDEECLVVPAQFDYWATKEVEAANERDILKDQADILKADLDDAKAKAELEIRGLSPGEINKIFELNLDVSGSLTVGTINSIILRHPDVIVARQIYRDKCNEFRLKASDAAVFRVGCKSIEKKMIMLDNLAKLHGQGYFSKIEGRKFKGQTLEALRKRVAETIRKDRAQRLVDKAKKSEKDKLKKTAISRSPRKFTR